MALELKNMEQEGSTPLAMQNERYQGVASSKTHQSEPPGYTTIEASGLGTRVGRCSVRCCRLQVIG